MTLREEDYCTVPENDMKIWRYMDFTQFISLLENGLHLRRADTFEDDYEGTLPDEMRDVRESTLSKYPDDWVESFLPKLRETLTHFTHLNCWHLNEQESAAMWDLYLNMDDGICVQTTVGNLKTALRESKTEYLLSKVEYIDYSSEEFTGWDQPLGNTISPFVHKRSSFEHENELRVIRHQIPFEENDGVSAVTAEDIQQLDLDEEQIPEAHKHISIDFERLIGSVYVAPHAGGWIEELLQDVREKYDLSFEITNSRMNEQPSY